MTGRISGMLAIGGFVLVCVLAFGFAFSRRPPNNAVPTPTAGGPLVLSGVEGSRTSDAFVLERGSYRATWSAWGTIPNEPPCTHSLALLGPAGQAISLARSVQVPFTGASAVVDVTNLEPGEYYLQINSECA